MSCVLLVLLLLFVRVKSFRQKKKFKAVLITSFILLLPSIFLHYFQCYSSLIFAVDVNLLSCAFVCLTLVLSFKRLSHFLGHSFDSFFNC